MTEQLKIALPKGRLLAETATMLERANWELSDYREGTRSYRLKSRRFPNLLAKIFHEKDIPVQVAVGNYDLGICGLDWVEELLVKYPSSALLKVADLGYGEGALYAVASRYEKALSLEEIRMRKATVRLVSEYPNLAESLALNWRLKRFSIFPLWGAAEVYPPESADLVLISGSKGTDTFNHDLVPMSAILSYNACLIANRNSWARADFSQIVSSINGRLRHKEKSGVSINMAEAGRAAARYPYPKVTKDTIRLALPDGHQQPPTLRLLSRVGIRIDDYPSPTGNRRPTISLPGVTVKVIRPQDMPLQVANGNFDLAITGRDWLTEHLYQFPSSPVAELLDLKFGRVKIVAVVDNKLPVDDSYGLRQFRWSHEMPMRVASEYVNIADKYARDNHLGEYRVIPTWGATEAFLPEDADLLIENSETGSTIARHNLKIIDTLFESTACLIGNKASLSNRAKGNRIKSIRDTIGTGVED